MEAYYVPAGGLSTFNSVWCSLDPASSNQAAVFVRAIRDWERSNRRGVRAELNPSRNTGRRFEFQ